MALDAKLKEALAQPLSADNVSQRAQGGMQLSYVEGWYVKAELNDVFGHESWDWVIAPDGLDKVQCEQYESRDKKLWKVGYTCIGKVIVRLERTDGTSQTVERWGAGFGQGIDADIGRAYESAIKEAETDAFKRAANSLGWRFGLSLYDKSQEHVEGSPAQGGKPAPTHRRSQEKVKTLLDIEVPKPHPKAFEEPASQAQVNKLKSVQPKSVSYPGMSEVLKDFGRPAVTKAKDITKGDAMILIDFWVKVSDHDKADTIYEALGGSAGDGGDERE